MVYVDSTGILDNPKVFTHKGPAWFTLSTLVSGFGTMYTILTVNVLGVGAIACFAINLLAAGALLRQIYNIRNEV